MTSSKARFKGLKQLSGKRNRGVLDRLAKSKRKKPIFNSCDSWKRYRNETQNGEIN